MTASDADPARASLDADVVYRWRGARPSRPRSGHARPRPATPTAFHLTVDLEVDLDGEPFFRRTWRETIERRLV